MLQIKRNGMKKFFKYLGFGLLSVVLFFIGIGIISSVGGIDNEEVFHPYIDTTLPKLATWDVSQYKVAMSQQGFDAITADKWELYLAKMSALGELRSIAGPELERSSVMSSIRSGKTTHAIYLVPVVFSTGNAHVRLGLQHNDGEVEINSISFLSDILFQ